jgi:glutamate-ammonia-ligase adenylyltransferase
MASDEQARSVLSRLAPVLLPALDRVPDPDQALSQLERFVRASGGGASVLAVLHERAAGALELLLFALGSSPFVANALVRHPDWAGALVDRRALAAPRRGGAFADEVGRAVLDAGPGGARDALRRTRRRETVRIALRDLRRLAPVEETLEALSDLADALVAAAHAVAEEEVRAETGLPPRAAGCEDFAVLALGKLGGSELNFSSDVDLVYVHREDRGPARRPGHAAAEALARRLTAVLGEPSHEGHVYRVDLRLRPEGGAGAISHSLPATLEYYRTRGAAWERLALIKARAVAGDARLARAVLRALSPFVWSRPFDPAAVAQVLRMKQDSDRRLAARGHSERHVKLGRGGIREIELLVQVLQLRSRGRRAALRSRATLPALDALQAEGLLPAPEADALGRAYLFLRDVENKLQMVHDSQTHLLPADAHERRLLARRLGYTDAPGATATDRLESDLAGHTDAVHRVFEERLKGS